MANKAERLLNLLAVLRETGRPLSAGEIRERVPGYPDSDTAFKRAFERDKTSLREMGIQISKVPVPASPEGVGYRATKQPSHLPDPGLCPEERAAMAVALSAVSVFAPDDAEPCNEPGRDLLYGALKIGVDPEPERISEVAAYLRVPAERLAAVVEAMVDRRLVEFEYEKADGEVSLRRLEPHGVRCIKNNWYLAASVPGEASLKVFRIDRIRSTIRSVSEPGAYETRDVGVVDEVLQGTPWGIGGGTSRRATVAVDPSVAALARRVFGVEPSGEDEDGRHLLEIEFANGGPLVDALAGFRDRAELLEPADLREAIRKRLVATVAHLRGESRDAQGDRAVALAEAARSRCDESVREGRPSSDPNKRGEAAGRARRLVNLVPWLIQNPGLTIDVVASKFGIPRGVLIKDLTMVTLTGVYPYTPSDLVDISWNDDRVMVRSAEYLRSFTDLTVEEAVVLYLALRAAAGLPGLADAPALTSGIEKLGRALGIEGGGVEMVAERAAANTLELLRKAIEGRETIQVTYVSYSSERETTRAVDPYVLFVYEGRWYLCGFCHSTQEERVFRVSRVSNVSSTGRHFKAPADRGGDPNGGSGRIEGNRLPGREGWKIEGIDLEVAMPPEVASWFTRAYPPTRVIELDNGWSYVKVKASTLTWATKVLFGIADRVRVISPEVARTRLAEAVERALEVYSGSHA